MKIKRNYIKSRWLNTVTSHVICIILFIEIVNNKTSVTISRHYWVLLLSITRFFLLLLTIKYCAIFNRKNSSQLISNAFDRFRSLLSITRTWMMKEQEINYYWLLHAKKMKNWYLMPTNVSCLIYIKFSLFFFFLFSIKIYSDY